MAAYSAALVKHATLAAATVDTVTLGSDANRVEVYNRGTGDLYFTVSGGTPTVAGDDCYIASSGAALQVDVPTAGNTVVKLISAAAVPYSVTGVL